MPRSLRLPDLEPDSVDFEILGGYPRIGIFSQIEAFSKNKHRHIVDISSIIFRKKQRVGEKEHSRTAS